MNYRYYGIAQLEEMVQKKNVEIKENKLSVLNIRRDFITMKNRQTDYQRFVNLLRQNDIPRIHQLIKTCLSSGGSIKTLTHKVMSAINGVYRPKGYTTKDMDLAMLTLRIGGPRLLHAFSVSNHLPESSVVYKALRQTMKINTSLDCPVESVIEDNINEFLKNRSGFFSLKMDEIAINPELRYCNEDNEFKGSCHNHKNKIDNYKFNNWIDLNIIKDALVSQEIHLAKECLIVNYLITQSLNLLIF